LTYWLILRGEGCFTGALFGIDRTSFIENIFRGKKEGEKKFGRPRLRSPKH
jgi:hypothetical protein